MDATACPGCRERDARIAALEKQLTALRGAVEELRRQLGRNASNSSTPPSANPPCAPPPVGKQPTGRRPGGQPGHPPHLKERLPPQRVTRVVQYLPKVCGRCQTPLPSTPGANDPEPSWHQVAELPPLAAQVVEYQGQARRCPGCGAVNREPIPAAVRAHSIGPRLAATLSYLAGCHHISKRGLEEIVEAVFEVPIALGTVTHLEGEMSQALASAHAAAVTAVQEASAKHVDETGWKLAGRRCWLWLAATTTVAVYLVHACRGLAALRALLGEAIGGILHSDRWSVYNRLPIQQRQLCWAHLQRDFEACLEYNSRAARAVGETGLAVARLLFETWHSFRGGGLTRRQLENRIKPLARVLHATLERGCRCAVAKVAVFCDKVLALEPALWTFVVAQGVEPTNNHAERLLRRGVLWRKNAFGCHSEAGCRFVERILTAVQTLRLQKRPVLAYLYEALAAYRQGLSPPNLILQG
jgi:transposase